MLACPLSAKNGLMRCSKQQSLFDHVVGKREQFVRNCEAQCLGGREIEDELEFGRPLNRDIAGLRPVQNLVDQVGGAPEQIREVWSVGHETPGLDIIPAIEDRRQSRGVRKRDDARAVGVNESIPHDVNCIRLGLERIERESNILRAPDFKWRDFKAERPGFGLNLTHLHNGLEIADIPYEC
jgi:hypothetical protein